MRKERVSKADTVDICQFHPAEMAWNPPVVISGDQTWQRSDHRKPTMLVCGAVLLVCRETMLVCIATALVGGAALLASEETMQVGEAALLGSGIAK